MEMCFSGKKASSFSQTLKFTSVLFWFGKSLYTRKKGHFEKKGTKKQSNVKVLIRNQVFWKLIRQRSPYHLHPTASLRYKPEEQFQEGKRFSQFLDVLQCWGNKFHNKEVWNYISTRLTKLRSTCWEDYSDKQTFFGSVFSKFISHFEQKQFRLQGKNSPRVRRSWISKVGMNTSAFSIL